MFLVGTNAPDWTVMNRVARSLEIFSRTICGFVNI